MAGNVTGNIGGSNVLLENAATEATLQLLLQATVATTAEQKKNIAALVQKAGLDPTKVEEANEGLSGIGKAAAITGGIFGGINTAGDQLTIGFNKTANVLTKFTDNQGKASDVFGTIAGMGGIIGLFATGLGVAAKFQEQQLATYQSLTQNGITFGGSLTNMRMAASGMYLSMDQFSKLMKENSQTFAKMGSTADEGAQAFTKVSQELMKGPMGRNLQALGYTAEQVNSGLATYMDTIGALGANGEKDQKKLAASAAEYMTQLDALSEITGKSKDEQLQAAKERAANAAWEAKLMTMSPEERKKAESAAAEALARGGKGAEQALMSAVMGFPPMTKAAREYTAIAGNMNNVTMKQAKAVTDSTKTVDDMRKIGTEYNAAAVADKKNLGQAGQAIIMQGGTMANTIAGVVGTANRAQKQNADTNEKAEAQAKKIAEDQKKRTESEAATAVDTQRALQQMGQAILNALMPAFQALQPYILKIAQGFADVVKWLTATPERMHNLGIAIAALTTAFVAAKAYQGAKSVIGAFSGGGGGGGATGAVAGGKGAAGAGSAIGGVADGLGKVGPMLGKLGKGAGDLFSGIMKGIAAGLKAFANPTILIGAAIFGAAITLIGAGIAGAAWILGKALPTLAEGMQGFATLDGKNLQAVGLGMIELGAGLAVFGAGTAMAGVGGVIGGLSEKFGSFFGAKSPIEKMKEFASLGPQLGEAGKSILSFNTSLASLLNTDLDKIKNLSTNLTRLATSLKELKEASKPVEKGFLDSATEMLKNALTPEVTKTPASDAKAASNSLAKTVADVKPVAPKSNDPTEILRAEVQTLNKISTEILKAIRDTADNTKSTASTLASNGNLFRRG